MWTSDDKYRDLRVNSRSRYAQMILHSNYWEALHPMLHETGKRVYVFAGDVGGNEDAIALFHDRWENVSLVASGMGEVDDENFLEVSVNGDSVVIEPIPLRSDKALNPIETYSLPAAPDSIIGPINVMPGTSQILYSVTEHLFATDVKWHYTGNVSGTAADQNILIDFESNFTEGTISAAYVRDAYGTGPFKELKIQALNTGVHNFNWKNGLKFSIENNQLTLLFSDEIPESCFIEIFYLNGTCAFQYNYIREEMYLPISISLDGLMHGMYLLKLSVGLVTYSSRIILH